MSKEATVSDEDISDEILDHYARRYERCRDELDFRSDVLKNAMVPWGMTATLLRELQRTRALLREQGWRPIESAPKDGTEILAFWGPFKLENGAVVDSKVYGTTLYARGSWVDPGDAGSEYRAPSHWQPLPPPPTEACP